MGFGDWLMLSGKVRELHDLLPGVKVVLSPEMEQRGYFREVFLLNPYITLLKDLRAEAPFISLAGHLPGAISEDGRKLIWNENSRAVRGDLFFTADELAFAQQALNEVKAAWERAHARAPAAVIVIHPWAKREQLFVGGRIKTYPFAANKEWGIEKYQRLADELAEEAVVVQLGPPDVAQDQLLKNAHPIRCQTFREAVAVLSLSDLYVGVEGGLHHGAAAMERPAVVIFGGWISPRTTGYSFHENVYVGDINAACGALEVCDHCTACMEKISVETVIDRVRLLLTQP